MEHLLEQVTAFAAKAHGEQLRKYSLTIDELTGESRPESYIAHPVRVMQTCKKYSTSASLLAAALLHDVLEDTATGKEEIHDFLLSVMNTKETDHTLQLVTELTDVYTKAAYPELNRRRRKAKELDRLEKISAEAQTIKYADIIDNVKGISKHDIDFAPLYLRECKAILGRITKGNPQLYDEAKKLVEEELQQLL